ncbi:hypothetical protein HY024_00210 [Candidatus Curtissbacteria bacterium]|nr:hypothetical protein [Candidatus Curtissbacteria bacterium]
MPERRHEVTAFNHVRDIRSTIYSTGQDPTDDSVVHSFTSETIAAKLRRLGATHATEHLSVRANHFSPTFSLCLTYSGEMDGPSDGVVVIEGSSGLLSMRLVDMDRNRPGIIESRGRAINTFLRSLSKVLQVSVAAQAAV